MSGEALLHPRATREALLGDTRVGYEFTRGQRRTIGFVIGAEGLSVRAPRWVALRDVDAAVQDKAGWILRKLAESSQRHARLEAARIDWRDGAVFPFLGRPLRLRLAAPRAGQRAGAATLEEESAAVATPDTAIGAAAVADADAGTRVLCIALPPDAAPEAIRDAVRTWLMRQARRLFVERLDHFAPRLGVRWTRLSLSNAATRWGSASSSGSIRLHWRLMHFRLAVVDYVVAHELSHLRVMDHSPRFWATVESVMPEFDALRRQLKDEAIPRW